MVKAHGKQSGVKLVQVRVQNKAQKLVFFKLYAGAVALHAHPYIVIAAFVQQQLGLLYYVQLVRGQTLARGKPGGKTGIGCAVACGDAGNVCKAAHILLGKAAFGKGAYDAA